MYKVLIVCCGIYIWGCEGINLEYSCPRKYLTWDINVNQA